MNATSRFRSFAFLTSSVFVLLTGFETASPEPQQQPAIVETHHVNISSPSPGRRSDTLEYRTSERPQMVNAVYERDGNTREAIDMKSHSALRPAATF